MPKHIGMLRDAYRAAPYFDEFIGAIENIYRSAPRNLAGFNLAFLEFMFQILEIDCELVFSSRLGCTGDRNSRLAATVKAVGGTHYLSGTGALDYLEPQVFHAADIILEIQSFTHPTYTQLHGEFIPGLSCLDILFNCGRQSARILRAKCAF